MTNETICRNYIGLTFDTPPLYRGCEDCASSVWGLCKDRSLFSPADTGTKEDRPPADPLEESISELKAANDELKTYLRKRKEIL